MVTEVDSGSHSIIFNLSVAGGPVRHPWSVANFCIL